MTYNLAWDPQGNAPFVKYLVNICGWDDLNTKYF